MYLTSSDLYASVLCSIYYFNDIKIYLKLLTKSEINI